MYSHNCYHKESIVPSKDKDQEFRKNNDNSMFNLNYEKEVNSSNNTKNRKRN